MILNAEKKSIRDYKEEITAMASAGKTAAEIAETIGYSKNYLIEYCDKTGILPRKARNYIEEQEGHDIMELYDHGVQLNTIARLIGRQVGSVKNYVYRAKVKRKEAEKEDTAIQTVMQVFDDAVDAVNAEDAATLPIEEAPAPVEQPVEIPEPKPIPPVLTIERVESTDRLQSPQVFEIPIILRVSTVYNNPEVNNIA